MFDNLSNRLEAIYKKLKGRGKLKEADVDEALREIRVALIEADVSLPVIKDFLAGVREKSIGHEVLKSLTPGHQMVKIVNDELGGVPLWELADGIRQALVTTNLHWGFHAWSIYAVCALVIAYFTFRRNEPSMISTPIKALFGGAAGD